MAVAPPNLTYLWSLLQGKVSGIRLSGIVGDAAHNYGFHRARNEVSSSDYSRQGPWNDGGPSNYASAIDLSMPPASMKAVTNRLIRSANDPDDPAMEVVREFFGTTNGTSVNGRAHTSPTGGWSFASSDKSHLWHVHISFFRDFMANSEANKAKMRLLAAVITGGAAGEGDDMGAIIGLKKGDKGDEVEYLQAVLGYAGYPVEVDSVWGSATSAALLKMRKAMGSSVTSADKVTGYAAAQLQKALAIKMAEEHGKPGPKGDPGEDGKDGKDGSAVLPPGTVFTATTK